MQITCKTPLVSEIPLRRQLGPLQLPRSFSPQKRRNEVRAALIWAAGPLGIEVRRCPPTTSAHENRGGPKTLQYPSCRESLIHCPETHNSLLPLHRPATQHLGFSGPGQLHLPRKLSSSSHPPSPAPLPPPDFPPSPPTPLPTHSWENSASLEGSQKHDPEGRESTNN